MARQAAFSRATDPIAEIIEANLFVSRVRDIARVSFAAQDAVRLTLDDDAHTNAQTFVER